MAKFGSGLNREVVADVNAGIIREPFSVADVKEMIQRKTKAWKSTPTPKYVNTCLADGASEHHSRTYKKYFEAVGGGKYRVREDYKRRQ